MKSFFNICLLLLIGCKPFENVYYQPSVTYALTDSLYSSNSKIDEIINPYKVSLDKEMNVEIGYCPKFISKARPSSELGSFMADALMTELKTKGFLADFCLLNYGGIRSTLDSGAITIGEIFQLMPFENELVIVELNQNQMNQTKEFILAKGGEPFSKEFLTLEEKDSYFVLTSDYIANGGDNYSVLTKAISRKNTGLKIRDALISHITRVKNIQLDSNPREL